jgi:hypothetical protein
MGPTNVEKARQEDPQSLRALYGEEGAKNATHGSDSVLSAQREIHFFFPRRKNMYYKRNLALEQSWDIPTGDQAKEYVTSSVMPVLTQGLASLCKQKPSEPIVSYNYAILLFSLTLNISGLPIGCFPIIQISQELANHNSPLYSVYIKPYSKEIQ